MEKTERELSIGKYTISLKKQVEAKNTPLFDVEGIRTGGEGRYETNLSKLISSGE